MSYKKTICIDFDGVINSYENGFQGKGKFDDPVPGCAEAIQNLKQAGHTIIIHTCRTEVHDIRNYLLDHNIPFDYFNFNPENREFDLNATKPLADIYIDDKALNFGGSWKGMVHKVENFETWLKTDSKRPTMNIEICGYKVDQIAIAVADMESTLQGYKSEGYSNWITDTVKAKDNIYEDEFVVKLAFNYEMMPVEFELICLEKGKTVQLPWNIHEERYNYGILSHYGFHVNDFERVIEDFKCGGYETLSIVETLHHSGCDHTYNYAFMDTRKLGFISKLITRKS